MEGDLLLPPPTVQPVWYKRRAFWQTTQWVVVLWSVVLFMSGLLYCFFGEGKVVQTISLILMLVGGLGLILGGCVLNQLIKCYF